MNRAVLRRIAMAAGVGMVASGGLIAAPVAAQMFSEGYEFLKAVKDRDGDAVTNALNQPGSTLVNTRDLTTGETAMHIVTQRRDLTWIRFLAQRGANPNIRDKKGIAPIQLAVQLGFVDGVEALIKAGASVDVSDGAGETPLIIATHRRDVPMVRLLLANGADPDKTDNSGRTAREYAELQGARSSIYAEFERADEEREGKSEELQYGPLF